MSDLAYVATRKGLVTLVRGAVGWRIRDVSFNGMNVPMMMADHRDGALYAALDHGHFGSKMHRSADRGKSWEEVAVPSYPPKPQGFQDICPMSRKERAWSLEKVWALEPAGRDEPGALWCGTIPGGLFRSDDRGQSWRLIESLWRDPARLEWFGGGYDLPGIHSICIDPRDSRKITVGVSCGGAWRSEDRGATWRVCSHGMTAEYMPPDRAGDPVAQDPHLIANCRSLPDVFWTQHHNGVFRSTDDCRSWHEIKNASPSKFGFAVAVDPNDANTAWFVPAVKDESRVPVEGRFVVSRTRDGGKSFEVMRTGLPQEHAFDLVYRHSLAVDASGRRLIMGSTTGNLWVSEDAGDSWQCLSSHLPPVYCVRFAEA